VNQRDDQPDANHLLKAVRLREDRRAVWEQQGEGSLWRNLSMIGALGWLIVVPTLLGIAAGRWLDRTLGTGVLFTGALVFVGVIAGGWLAWRRMNER